MSGNPLKDKQAEFDDRQSHLKAQNDLLALKMLHEPEFMKRVPVLSPVREQDLEREGSIHSAEPALPDELHFSLASVQGRQVNDMEVNSPGQDLEGSGFNDSAVHALSAEVLVRVRDHLDSLLPDLIASTLEEVLRDWARHKK